MGKKESKLIIPKGIPFSELSRSEKNQLISEVREAAETRFSFKATEDETEAALMKYGKSKGFLERQDIPPMLFFRYVSEYRKERKNATKRSEGIIPKSIPVYILDDIEQGKQIPARKVTHAYLGMRKPIRGEKSIRVKIGKKIIDHDPTGFSLFELKIDHVPKGFKRVKKAVAFKEMDDFFKEQEYKLERTKSTSSRATRSRRSKNKSEFKADYEGVRSLVIPLIKKIEGVVNVEFIIGGVNKEYLDDTLIIETDTDFLWEYSGNELIPLLTKIENLVSSFSLIVKI